MCWSRCRVGLAPTGKTSPLHGARQEQTSAYARARSLIRQLNPAFEPSESVLDRMTDAGLLSIQHRHLCGRDTLESKAVGQSFLEPAAESIRESHSRVAQCERALLLQIPSQFPRSRQQSLTRDNLVHRAVRLRLCRAQLLAAEQEVTAANLADDFGPHDMQTIARHDAECGMRCILKVGILGGNDDVAEQCVLRMRGHWAIDGRD